MPLMIEVKVVPSSGRQECILDKAGMLKCYLKNPPEDGKANAELIELLAKAIKKTRGHVQIVAGHTGRKKLIKIEHNINFDTLLALLGIEQQATIE
jgi:uncharacterized protein (TIGR00251 family)